MAVPSVKVTIIISLVIVVCAVTILVVGNAFASNFQPMGAEQRLSENKTELGSATHLPSQVVPAPAG